MNCLVVSGQLLSISCKKTTHFLQSLYNHKMSIYRSYLPSIRLKPLGEPSHGLGLLHAVTCYDYT